MGARGACLRIVILTRGASIFFCLAGWDFSTQADFFSQFSGNFGSRIAPKSWPRFGPKPWPRTWSKNVVQKLHQKFGPCGFCIGAPQWANALQSHFALISAPNFGINSISLATFLVQFLHQVLGPIPEPKIPKTCAKNPKRLVQKLRFRNCFLIAWGLHLNPKPGFEIAQNSKPAARLRPPFGHSSSSIGLASRATTSAQKLCIQACALLAAIFNPRPVHTTSNACGT